MNALSSTPDNDITDIIHEATGQNIASKTRIAIGESSEVYSVRVVTGTEAILRINDGAINNYFAEAWAIEQARNVGMPVPHIIHVGSKTTLSGTLHYSIEELIAGESFDNLLWRDHISKDRVRTIAVQAGELLAKLHRIDTSGWGKIDENGVGSYGSAAEWVSAEFHDTQKIETLFKGAKLDARLLGKTLKRLDDSSSLFQTTSYLLHMDYGPKHMFVDKSDNIVGIIDFEEAASGDIAFDFNGWPFWLEDTVPTQWILEGYERVCSLGENFNERLARARLCNRIGLLHYATGVNAQPKWATAAANSIRELMEGY